MLPRAENCTLPRNVFFACASFHRSRISFAAVSVARLLVELYADIPMIPLPRARVTSGALLWFSTRSVDRQCCASFRCSATSGILVCVYTSKASLLVQRLRTARAHPDACRCLRRRSFFFFFLHSSTPLTAPLAACSDLCRARPTPRRPCAFEARATKLPLVAPLPHTFFFPEAAGSPYAESVRPRNSASKPPPAWRLKILSFRVIRGLIFFSV